MSDYLWFHINNYVGHGSEQWNQINALLFLVYVQRHIFRGGRAHYLYFWQRAFNTQARPSRKISINNRQTDRNYAACSSGKGEMPRSSRPQHCLYLYFFLPFTEVCANIHWTLSLPFSLRRIARRSLKESLPVTALLFTIMASYFSHDKLHTMR